MKEYKISELMENYTDNEIFLEGEQIVDTDKAVTDLLAQVRPKKKMKPLFKGLVAAAAAVVVLTGSVITAAALGIGFTTATGRQVEFFPIIDGKQYAWSTSTFELDDALTLEDGRLILNVDGKSIDITDKVDRKTPYIYSYELPESEKTAYVIAGGTPEEYGVLDMVYNEEFGWLGVGAINGSQETGGRIFAEIDYTWHDEWERGEIRKVRNWYMTTQNYDIQYVPKNDDEHVCIHYNARIFPTWRDECHDAWLIQALLDLDLIQLPTIGEFVPPTFIKTAKGELWIADDNYTVTRNLTDLIAEDKVHFPTWSTRSGMYESEEYLAVGGTPDDYGWAVLLRENGECWTVAEYNIRNADGTLREWYLKAVEHRGLDLEQLQQNYYFTFE